MKSDTTWSNGLPKNETVVVPRSSSAAVSSCLRKSRGRCLPCGSIPKRNTRGYAETSSAEESTGSAPCEPGSKAEGHVLLLLQIHVTRRGVLLENYTTSTSIGAHLRCDTVVSLRGEFRRHLRAWSRLRHFPGQPHRKTSAASTSILRTVLVTAMLLIRNQGSCHSRRVRMRRKGLVPTRNH